MIKSIPENQVKRRFSELLKLVEAGQEITVTRRGMPIARIVPARVGDGVQAARVGAAFAELASLCGGLDLEGDLKQISREGLA